MWQNEVLASIPLRMGCLALANVCASCYHTANIKVGQSESHNRQSKTLKRLTFAGTLYAMPRFLLNCRPGKEPPSGRQGENKNADK
jgi:hypothetical protein